MTNRRHGQRGIFAPTEVFVLGGRYHRVAGDNAGGGAVRRAGGIPPYGQTQAYVAKVMGLLGGRT